ncbi:helix-turn-helix domain-containing protein [Ligilactobacillus sp. LYQ139]|uniref:helix-turn-helix domain-containing protein n=1 Tax=Ligilactobacillus sp. LYQ139 TaxID=3378800 RepID=UPI003853113F
MNVLDRIKKLAKKQGKSLNQVANELGLGNSTLYRWDTQIPNGEYLSKVADYFHVSTDYLLGREDKSATSDLKQFLEENYDSGMTFEGRPLTDDERERLKIALTQVFWKYHNKL